MTNFKKTLLGVAAAMALAAPVANAAFINVGGVVWDPDSAFDFNATSATIVQATTTVAGPPPVNFLSGFGVIDTINSTTAPTFCPSGCEVTFTFGGYIQTTGVLPFLEFSGGWVNVFVDHTPNFNTLATTLAASGADDGDLFLTLSGHLLSPFEVGLVNPLTTTLRTSAFGLTGVQGLGLLDVQSVAIAGPTVNPNPQAGNSALATANFDTNQMPIQDPFSNPKGCTDAGLTNCADLSFSTTFTSSPSFTRGSGTFTGQTIPEPATLALLGIGLLGMGGLSARKRAKA